MFDWEVSSLANEIDMQKLLFITGSVLGAIGVILGAFGAHAFKSILEANQRIATFETAVKYHFFHVVALFIAGFLLDKYPSKFLTYSGIFFTLGILLFSGSLYILSLTNQTKWGAIAPIGGLAFVLGWIFILIAVLKN